MSGLSSLALKLGWDLYGRKQQVRYRERGEYSSGGKTGKGLETAKLKTKLSL